MQTPTLEQSIEITNRIHNYFLAMYPDSDYGMVAPKDHPELKTRDPHTIANWYGQNFEVEYFAVTPTIDDVAHIRAIFELWLRNLTYDGLPRDMLQ